MCSQTCENHNLAKSKVQNQKFVSFSCSPMRSYKIILYAKETSEFEHEFKLWVMMSLMNPC